MKKSQEGKLGALESEYAMLLRVALEECASGRWGLFGQNDRAIEKIGRYAKEHLISAEVRQLLELGVEIDALRVKVGCIEPFHLHARLMRMRASHDANTPGESALARAWLEEIRSSDS